MAYTPPGYHRVESATMSWVVPNSTPLPTPNAAPSCALDSSMQQFANLEKQVLDFLSGDNATPTNGTAPISDHTSPPTQQPRIPLPGMAPSSTQSIPPPCATIPAPCTVPGYGTNLPMQQHTASLVRLPPTCAICFEPSMKTPCIGCLATIAGLSNSFGKAVDRWTAGSTSKPTAFGRSWEGRLAEQLTTNAPSPRSGSVQGQPQPAAMSLDGTVVSLSQRPGRVAKRPRSVKQRVAAPVGWGNGGLPAATSTKALLLAMPHGENGIVDLTAPDRGDAIIDLTSDDRDTLDSPNTGLASAWMVHVPQRDSYR
ncbi:hypothetical protein BAUCODRAFT_306198 [Baudoinia panamericana UAMH 10762]|uniref:Uncharacterized protein n=1 Tax=Baudoinia panamericana (strain UAMH 10762) TaxID=717646 RepID=M2LCX3_BAUPA|nr:uncharacterized protein BAUCODRAFT_306198 [Baudoinia panamericana UAMH 10762]EMC91827.1 hypothetical protein BAUCODRAFT_306198 [Baudoinia panamericana UAMH 10762]